MTHVPLQPYVSVWDAIGDLPAIPAGTTHPDVPNHRTPNHQQKTIDAIASTPVGERVYESWGQKIRLPPDEPAPTLLAGKRETFHFVHPRLDRGLSIRERARLQTFPDDFVFLGTVTDQRTQTGNAVPTRLASALASHISTALHDSETPR